MLSRVMKHLSNKFIIRNKQCRNSTRFFFHSKLLVIFLILIFDLTISRNLNDKQCKCQKQSFLIRTNKKEVYHLVYSLLLEHCRPPVFTDLMRINGKKCIVLTKFIYFISFIFLKHRLISLTFCLDL